MLKLSLARGLKKETLGFLQIISASLVLGFIPILVKYGIGFGVYNLSFFRIFVSIILLGLFFLFSKHKLARFKYERGKLVLFGAIHGFIILGYFLAIQFLSVASAVLLLYSSSIWIVLFSYFILKEKITIKTVFALIVSFIGLLFVLSPSSFFIKESLIGSVAGLIAGVGFGWVYAISKTFKHYDKVSLTFWQNLIAIPFLLPLIFITVPVFNTINLWVVFILGLITVIGFVLVFKGFEKVSAQKGGVVILFDIIFPVLFAWIIFKEIPSWNVLVGAVMIIIGSYIASR